MNFNRRKYQIFLFLSKSNSYVTADELISNLNITSCNARTRLSKMTFQEFIIRSKRGHYRLGSKGERVFKQLEYRKDIETVTGREVSFNLKKPIPFDILMEYKKLKQEVK